MARIGGRSAWLAWPVGLVCAGVVAGLVWLAVPALPWTVAFVGDTLRQAATPVEADAATPIAQAVLDDAVALDCRDVYPSALWAQLSWTPDVLLGQTFAAPPTAVPSLVDALQPTVRVTCAWRTPQGTVTTTFAQVSADAAAVAQAALTAAGFSCTAFGDGVACDAGPGAPEEHQVLRDGLWLTTSVVGWAPEDYVTRLEAGIWP